MQIKRQIFLIMNRKCYLCIENKKRTPNSALITKSYDKSVWCNFSVHCLKFYSPVTTQYIKLEMPDSWNDSYIDVYIGEINAIK
ncbi:hypothetical protein F070042J6_13270 [Bacteroides sp. f07]